jgi:hypothetical protein
VVVDSLGKFLDAIIRKLVLDIVANLRRAPSEGGTPVDTGWARANWVANIGVPYPTTAGTRAEAEAGRLYNTAETQVAVVAATYRFSQGEVHITNNVPYIQDLNEGSSSQAPRAFVQAAVAKAVRVDLPRGLR